MGEAIKANPTGESPGSGPRLEIDRCLMFQFRELGGTLGLAAMT